MKTLVIHPNDRSTDFLKDIYKGKDWTIVNDSEIYTSRNKLTKLIKDHGRIIMMGHGSPNGLFYTCINSEMVYLLREKLCVCIWCNADMFVEKYGLRGFYTGMFISEVDEAYYHSIRATRQEIEYSNALFAREMNKHIDMICVHSLIKESYNSVDNPVIRFNNERLYERDDVQDAYDTMVMESNLAAKDLADEMDDDDIDPAGGHGIHSHI